MAESSPKMSQEQSEETTDVKTAEEIKKMPVDNEVKFGVLVGLVKVGQLSNKDVVDTVLYLLVGGEFDLESNFIIEDARNIHYLLSLVDVCSVTLQAEIWSHFTAILRKSIRNLQACTEVSLIGEVLSRLATADDMVADLLVDMLAVIAGYSITVKELKTLFGFLKARNGKWPRHSIKLLSVLQHMPQRHGPDEFFSFSGKKGSAIALPPIKQFPYHNGWSFSTWVRLDPAFGANIEREKPFLYCFRTEKEIGYSAHFVGNALVITSMRIKGKGFQHCVNFEFIPRKWHMVTIVHTYNRWSKSFIDVYIDGDKASNTEMAWFINSPDPFSKCFIGSTPEHLEEDSFCGQMSTLYMFNEALNANQVHAMYQLGAAYKSQFKFENECHTLLNESQRKVLYDGKLTNSIVFMYNPIACDSQLCLESSPKGNPSIFIHTPHALMLEGVKAVVTYSINSTLHSIGGVQSIFPLFGQLDMTQENAEGESSTVDNTVCSTLMGLLCDLLESSQTIQQQFLQNKGFLVISYLLEKTIVRISTDAERSAMLFHITEDLLNAFLKLTKYLVNLSTGSALLKHLFDHILFNPSLWIYSPVEVQEKLYTYLATDFIQDANIYNNIRRVSAVLQTMHTLKYYYWVVNPKDRSGIVPKGIEGKRPCKEDIVKLRGNMLSYLKQLIFKGQGILEDELQSILNYLTTLHEDENLHDVLHLMVRLMAEHPSSMVPAFDRRNGIRTVFKLLASPNEIIRVRSLKLLGYFLMRSTHKRKIDSTTHHNLFSLVAERLTLHSSSLTLTTYNVLFELVVERMANVIITGIHPEPDSSFRLENPLMLKVIATLIRQSQPSEQLLQVKKLFLSDLTILCSHNKDNKRTILQMSVWQDWLFSLGYTYPSNQVEQKITEMVMTLFRILLHHAIKLEYGGWRVWIDTLAILHSKISYEDFRLHMAKVYHQYQQQHAEANDQQHFRPINTVSGASAAASQRPPARESTVTISDVTEPNELEAVENKGMTEEATTKEETHESEEKKEEDNLNNTDDLVPDHIQEFVNEVIENAIKIVENGKDSEDSPQDVIVKQEQQHKTTDDENISSENVDQKVESTSQENEEKEPVQIVEPKPITEPVRSEESATPKQSNHSRLQQQTSTGSRQTFNPPPRAAPFRIPEFHWSYLHQTLLSDLMFVIEQDMQVWKSQTTKTIIDFVNASENQVFVVNTIHMISQLSDMLIMACGGLLPLLAAATSANAELEIMEPNYGLSVEQAVSFLDRIISMADILIFASTINFAELEQEKNMSSGGILRQSLRLVCTATVRNCLECRHRQLSCPDSRPSSPTTPESPVVKALIGGVQPSAKNIVENLGSQNNPIRDVDRLLQDMDINRLKACVYRDVEEAKHAQFLALAIVYFTSVLMVSKYRDILEPPIPSTPSSAVTRSLIHSPSSRSRESYVSTSSHDIETQDDTTEPSIAEHATEHTAGNTAEHTAGNTAEATDTQEDEEKENEADVTHVQVEVDVHEENRAEGQMNGDIATEENDTEEAVEPQSLKDAIESVVEDDQGEPEAEVTDMVNDEQLEEVSLDDSVKKDTGDNQDKTVEDKSDVPDGDEKSTNDIDEKNSGVIKSNNVDTNEARELESTEDAEGTMENRNGVEISSRARTKSDTDPHTSKGIASINVSSQNSEKDNKMRPDLHLNLENNIPRPVENLPPAVSSMSLTERLERALGTVAPLLREIFVDFSPFLSKTLLGSHGQDLFIGGLVTLKQSTSVVELVMLLCSQEWQNSLQKHAGLAFIELVNEGRLLSHATRDHIVRVANEAEFILNRMRAEDVQKHAEFESLCAQTMHDRKEEEKLCDHLITSARRRDAVIATKLKEKILNILTNRHGAWGNDNQSLQYCKLDCWEDDSRRRRRLIKNVNGTAHPEATLKAAIEHGANEDAISQAREAFHAHLHATQQAQLTQDFTDEELLQTDEKELDIEFAGPVAVSTQCILLAPGVSVYGTMSITKFELYFEMDDDNLENKKHDPKVLQYVDHLHGKWNFTEIRAIFTRRYLLQNVAIELFMSNRTAVMFAFPDHTTVKKVINVLPRVGVGVKYGLPQARRSSLAAPKQLFKLSTMTQKWQRRELSNYDYLMYLNTIAGRTYNDLNQYPVFPWVISNYESNDLDLSLPSNYRDLSKPIGALNPTRKQFFEERYNTWDNDQIKPFHYGTHYSTSAFTLNWLLRLEPFTTMFLHLQGGKFDHANRTFHSLAQSWKNCQRDTSDVKELIPEFFYLPELFTNRNNYKLGTTEDGLHVDSVVLPNWAKTAEDFVRINRMALESEIVSCQLHQWIDLIFGYKQRGPEAARATNVFYYLTYDGSVNLEDMKDPVMKEAIENQIRCFGQTPAQLLTEPHPPRNSAMHVTPMMFSNVQDDVCMIMKFLSNSPVIHVAANTHPLVPTPAVISVTANHNFSVNRWNELGSSGSPSSPATSGPADKGDTPQLPLSMDPFLVQHTNLQRRMLGDNFDQRLAVNHTSFVVTSDNRYMFACQFWDKSFRVFAIDTAKTIQVIYGHFDVVTCISRSESSLNQDCYVVTGSKDCTVMLWHWFAKHQSIMGDNGSFVSPTPKATLTGHEQEVTCVLVSTELGLVISGSKDGPCLMHSTTGDLLCSMESPQNCLTPEILTLTREGYIVVNYDKGTICLFSINGKYLLDTQHKDNIQSMLLSRNGEYLMTAGTEGTVVVWRTHDLNQLYNFPTCDSGIKTLALSHDQRYLVAGLGSGCIIVFNIDFNKWHHEFQDRYQ